MPSCANYLLYQLRLLVSSTSAFPQRKVLLAVVGTPGHFHLRYLPQTGRYYFELYYLHLELVELSPQAVLEFRVLQEHRLKEKGLSPLRCCPQSAPTDHW